MDLYEAITTQGGFPVDVVKEVFGQLCDAIIYCHAENIYHRDLKPENVLISIDFRIKLADFGLACHDEWSREFGCGSVRYMAPECLADPGLQAMTRRSFSNTGYSTAANDCWSLGVILINLLFGKNPWHQASSTDPIFSSYIGKNSNILKQQFKLSPEFDAMLHKIFALDERLRPSVEELKMMIDSCESFIEISPPLPPKPKPTIAPKPQKVEVPIVPSHSNPYIEEVEQQYHQALDDEEMNMEIDSSFSSTPSISQLAQNTLVKNKSESFSLTWSESESANNAFTYPMEPSPEIQENKIHFMDTELIYDDETTERNSNYEWSPSDVSRIKEEPNWKKVAEMDEWNRSIAKWEETDGSTSPTSSKTEVDSVDSAVKEKLNSDDEEIDNDFEEVQVVIVPDETVEDSIEIVQVFVESESEVFKCKQVSDTEIDVTGYVTAEEEQCSMAVETGHSKMIFSQDIETQTDMDYDDELDEISGDISLAIPYPAPLIISLNSNEKERSAIPLSTEKDQTSIFTFGSIRRPKSPKIFDKMNTLRFKTNAKVNQAEKSEIPKNRNIISYIVSTLRSINVLKTTQKEKEEFLKKKEQPPPIEESRLSSESILTFLEEISSSVSSDSFSKAEEGRWKSKKKSKLDQSYFKGLGRLPGSGIVGLGMAGVVSSWVSGAMVNRRKQRKEEM
ncbi:hypothetical protein HK096_003599, partial [Nowakowskiella sp. JEL0078]